MGNITSNDLQVSYDRNSKIGKIADILMRDREIGDEIIIDIDKIPLNEQERSILKGLILASGYEYYEVSDVEDTKFIAELRNL